MKGKAPGKGAGGARQPPERLAVGRIVRPHGVRGRLVAEPYSDLLKSLPGTEVFLGEITKPYRLTTCQRSRGRLLVGLEGVDDRNEAEKLRGLEITIPWDQAESLPEGTYYHWQILGLEVETEEQKRLGVVEEILETGANDVYVVRGDRGEEILLPAIASVVRSVDLNAGKMTVSLLPGLLAES